jgi:hypothetical protein
MRKTHRAGFDPAIAGLTRSPKTRDRKPIITLCDSLSFLLIIPTYPKEDLTTALAAYRNGKYTSIRKCAYAFNIPVTTVRNHYTRDGNRTRLACDSHAPRTGFPRESHA